MKTTQEIVLFSPVFCPTIGGRFILTVKYIVTFSSYINIYVMFRD